MLVVPQIAELLYWFFQLGAFAIGMAWAAPRMRRVLPPSTSAMPLLLFIFAGGLIGAKIFWIIQFSSVTTFWRAITYWEGGLVYYGGLAGGILAIYLYSSIKGVSLLGIFDAATPVSPWARASPE